MRHKNKNYIAECLCLHTSQLWALTWEDAVEDLQFVGIFPPQAQDVVLPANHFAEDEHDRDGGQANEQEQRVGPLHNIQALLMAHHLESRRTVTKLTFTYNEKERLESTKTWPALYLTTRTLFAVSWADRTNLLQTWAALEGSLLIPAWQWQLRRWQQSNRWSPPWCQQQRRGRP